MQWRSAGETRFATPVSRISGLPRAGILRLTAWPGISVRAGLPSAGIRPAAWLRVSGGTGLSHAGIRPAARLGISVRTRLLRSLEPRDRKFRERGAVLTAPTGDA